MMMTILEVLDGYVTRKESNDKKETQNSKKSIQKF